MDTLSVTNNVEARQFEVKVEDQTAFLIYDQTEDTLTLIETQVPKALEGKGIGSSLAKAGLEYARQNKLGVLAICPFVKAYLQKHPEYQDLIRSE